ncbi:hypothetical protein [Streptomyces sp. R08]|uniref:Uncharacterized protein n=1 Tax=Streptomyces sp. R08 TaxID=3238624 RepID=A0AB39MT26_9ACTN
MYPPYPTGPLGEIELPDLGLPELTADEAREASRETGAQARL